MQQRQLAWLQRYAEGPTPSSWRLVKWHRVSSRLWVYSLDRQLLTSTASGGLAGFRYVAGASSWREWQSCPYLAVAMDLGSDGVCGWNALAWDFDINTVARPDPPHGCQRSLENCLRQSGCWDFWLLMLITWNLEFGPWQEAGRRNELGDTLGNLYTNFEPFECLLFLHHVGQMVKDLEDHNVYILPLTKSLEAELWDFLGNRVRNPVAGRRAALNRFGGAYHPAKKCKAWWTVMQWERTYLAMEQDMLRGKDFQAKLRKTAAPAEASAIPKSSTDGRRIRLGDRTIRGRCENAVAISVRTLQEARRKQTIDGIIVAGEPLDK